MVQTEYEYGIWIWIYSLSKCDTAKDHRARDNDDIFGSICAVWYQCIIWSQAKCVPMQISRCLVNNIWNNRCWSLRDQYKWLQYSGKYIKCTEMISAYFMSHKTRKAMPIFDGIGLMDVVKRYLTHLRTGQYVICVLNRDFFDYYCKHIVLGLLFICF